jgi:hypothetical protein
MASSIFKRGNRLFAFGSIGLIVASILHTIGHFAPTGNDPALITVDGAMRAYRFDMGLGMHPSIMDVLDSMSLTMTITVLFLGLYNLMTLALAGNNAKLVRRLIALNVLGTGAIVALYAFYRIPPPLICFAVAEILFLLALIPPREHGKKAAMEIAK